MLKRNRFHFDNVKVISFTRKRKKKKFVRKIIQSLESCIPTRFGAEYYVNCENCS